MNMWQKNFPRPLDVTIHSDVGLSARTPVVIDICNKVNEMQEYMRGLEAAKVLVPDPSNCDERMPLTFLRPCIAAINAIIQDYAFTIHDIEPIPQLGDNMDYHAFVPVCRTITRTINRMLEEW